MSKSHQKPYPKQRNEPYQRPNVWSAGDDASASDASTRRARGSRSIQGSQRALARVSHRGQSRWRLPLVTLVSAVVAGGTFWLIRVALAGALALALGAGGTHAQAAAKMATPTPVPTPRPPGAPVPVGTFATRVYTAANGARMTYYLYGPNTYTPSGSYPLVVVLHGGGEVAYANHTAEQNRDALISQAYVQPFTTASVQQQWPCFIVAPQATAGQRWVNEPASATSYTLARQPAQPLALAQGIVHSLLQTYPMIDPNRIYVEGISMGAFGTWEAAERWPGMFAAAIPISGAGDPKAAAAMVHVAVWAFHGALDDTVPVQGSRLMVQAIRAAGGTPCYTEYPTDGHGIWNSQHMLSDPQVLSWLFSQTKARSSASPPQACPAQA